MSILAARNVNDSWSRIVLRHRPCGTASREDCISAGGAPVRGDILMRTTEAILGSLHLPIRDAYESAGVAQAICGRRAVPDRDPVVRGAACDGSGRGRRSRARGVDPSRQPGQRRHAADRRRDSADAGARAGARHRGLPVRRTAGKLGRRGAGGQRRRARCSAHRCAASISSVYGIEDVRHGVGAGPPLRAGRAMSAT